MLQNSYDIDSDSDEDEENNNTNKEYPLVQDIQSLKVQTLELLDPVWKDSRNKHLLMKMLKLDEPIITAKMVDFLLQDGVCEILLGFITLVGTNQPRPSPADGQSESLKLSYKAVLVLSADEPSEPLVNLFSKRTVSITRTMFEIFRDDSAASFYHAFRVFESLLRCYPGDVYEGICGDNKASDRMASLLKYIGYAPIGELLVMIVALTPVSRASQLYITCAKSRWMYFEHLSQWVFLYKIADIVVHPEQYCCITADVTADDHSSAASQVFQELIEKLSLEEVGEILLQPLGYTTQLLDMFINAATDMKCEISRRRTSIQILCFLLRRAAEPEVMCMVAGGPGNVATPSIVSNRLHPLRERIINHLESRMTEIFQLIASFESNNSTINRTMCEISGPIQYSAYKIDQPFTTMRTLLIEYLTLMIESDEMIALQLSVSLWVLLMKWTIQYAHNSIYHAFFYRLIFAVLRQNQDIAMRILFQKARLVSFLIDSYIPLDLYNNHHHNTNNTSSSSSSSAYHKDDDDNRNHRRTSRKGSGGKHDKHNHNNNNNHHQKQVQSPETIAKIAVRGLILNCANCIRLQAACLAPSSYLRQFLAVHPRWQEFYYTFVNDTEDQQRYGMGIKIADHRNTMSSLSNLVMMGNPSNPQNGNMPLENADSGIDHGSRYAKCLGFYDEIPWEGDDLDEPANLGDLSEMTITED